MDLADCGTKVWNRKHESNRSDLGEKHHREKLARKAWYEVIAGEAKPDRFEK